MIQDVETPSEMGAWGRPHSLGDRSLLRLSGVGCFCLWKYWSVILWILWARYLLKKITNCKLYKQNIYYIILQTKYYFTVFPFLFPFSFPIPLPFPFPFPLPLPLLFLFPFPFFFPFLYPFPFPFSLPLPFPFSGVPPSSPISMALRQGREEAYINSKVAYEQ